MDSTKEEVLKFLEENFILNLAYTDGDNPMISVLLFYIDKDFNFYFGTHTKSYKAQALEKNPSVSLNVWQHNQMMIQANGKASRLTDEKEIDFTLDKLAQAATLDKNFWPPLLRIEGNNYVVYKIKPEWMRKLDLTRNTISQDTSPFTEILLRNEG
jgi:nitroimidazol reductase NimA-like FMN-containing flavoprotein (pyridoxamine 5'-phosphate oxidase superfamily)